MSLVSQCKSAMGGALKRWFPCLFWPLTPYDEEVDTHPPDGGLRRHLAQARFNLRLQRYWWVARRIQTAAARTHDRIVVVDVGCERGWLKRFVGKIPNVYWIGLDGKANRPSLHAAGYDEVHTAYFEEPLPLPDQTADFVVSLHVFEHLENPASTASEAKRILKPGGVFLAGTPVSPAPVATVCTKILQARRRAGRSSPCGHVRNFSPGEWVRRCSEAGLELQWLTGSYLIRHTGFFLENRRWWVRLNQFLAALFPSLGQEACVAARRPAKQTANAGRVGWWQRVWLRLDWAVLATGLLALAVLAVWSVPSRSRPRLTAHIQRHQDGDDVFYFGPYADRAAKADPQLASLSHINQVHAKRTTHKARGQDLHLIVPARHARKYLDASASESFRMANQWRAGSRRFLVLRSCHRITWTIASFYAQSVRPASAHHPGGETDLNTIVTLK